MVEAAGIEPALTPDSTSTQVGLSWPTLGPYGTQVGHAEGVAVCPMCKGRTPSGHDVSSPGRDASTTGAQQTSIDDDLEVELKVVAET